MIGGGGEGVEELEDGVLARQEVLSRIEVSHGTSYDWAEHA